VTVSIGGDASSRYSVVAAHFEARAARYDSSDSWVADAPTLRPIMQLLCQMSVGVTLEIGAGTGAVARFCVSAMPCLGRFIGVDIAHSMLLQHVPHAPAVVGDVHRLPIKSGSVDIGICRQAIHYFNVPEVALTEIRRVLAPHGRLLIAQIVPFADLDDEAWWKQTMVLRQPVRQRQWTSAELQAAAQQSGFAIESVRYVRRRTSLSGWLNRYPLAADARQALLTHYDAAPASVRALREFSVTPGEVEYSLRWVFITART
jgi:ubiquinone/menaquinone biosynthesis C-methylase UbiE